MWLDHDLGGAGTIWPVVELLERAAFEKRPFDIGTVYVHSANPSGATRIAQALGRWGYHVRLATGSPYVGYGERTARPCGTGGVSGRLPGTASDVKDAVAEWDATGPAQYLLYRRGSAS